MRRDSQLLPQGPASLPHGMGSLGHLSSNLAPHPQMRPEMSRAVSFPIPTPPSSASSINMNGSENFHWNQPNMISNSGTAPLAIDTVINSSRSMPTTPATTPPGGTLQQLQQFNPSGNFNEPRSSPLYAPQAQNLPQSTVSQQNMTRFGPPLPQPHYMSQPRDNMPPPNSRAQNTSRPSSSPNNPDGQLKDENGIEEQGTGEEEQEAGEEEADHEPEHEYDSSVNQYNNINGRGYFQPGDTPHLSPDMTGSPNHQGPGTPNRSVYSTPNINVSRNIDNGGSTPRTGSTPQQQQWVPQSGYSTPPRGTTNTSGVRPSAPARSIYNNMIGDGTDRTVEGSNGGNTDNYNHGIGVPVTPNQSQTFGNINGPNKRIREMDEDGHGSRPSSRGDDERGASDEIGLKRRKTISQPSGHSAPAANMGTSSFDNRDAAGRNTLNRARSTTNNPRRGR